MRPLLLVLLLVLLAACGDAGGASDTLAPPDADAATPADAAADTPSGADVSPDPPLPWDAAPDAAPDGGGDVGGGGPGPVRAVIEGYYGPPWSHEARLDVIAFAGRAGMNTYLLAAKHDPANTLLWDRPLTAQRRREFDELTAAGREHGVRLCVAISPGGTVEFGSETHRAAAVGRFVELAEHGVDCFVLAFDDTPKTLKGDDPARYASYAEGQADFVADVFDRTRAAEGEGAVLVFVPNDYWTEAAEATDELATVAAALPADVGIAWTGPQICAPSITAEDAAAFAALVGRAPILGDNDLVKDGDATGGNLALAPYAPREAALLPALGGFGVNLMPLPYASFVGLWTAAAWAADPAGYDPQAALAAAAEAVAGDDAELLLRLAPFSVLACPDGERVPLPDAPALAACRAALAGDRAALAAVCEPVRDGVLPGLGGLPDALAAADLPGALANELRPWAQKLDDCALIAHDALDLAIGAATGTLPPAGQMAAVESSWQTDCVDASVRLRLAELDALVRAALAFTRAGR